ncbi:tyrosine--tRNA ligase [Helcococcus ovis]|uniref:Tyrosine--tRNA ligase n=1 Tax=Helcococcus ovis TaxID=72026 RepID=A0A4R9C3P8_9FIRM|nr:tyrosine--tRNA ligase [Helcococcus ovis]TFF65162.1 tyrosine--tRNA ligase [Helcococcus ovis]TFF66308.1 tyrosine--tRNA ligase [Helcococcus ovis]
MKYEIKHKSVYDELVERGYLDHCTHEEDLKKLLIEEKVPFYIGFDATADSLTLGHWIQVMVMMRMQAHGHIPVALLGGGTTMIGDPSGRSDMRMVMTKEKIDYNAQRFYNQFQKYINFSDGKAIIDNNANWLLDLNFLNFMREIGVHFNVNEMLKKDAYKNRMEKGLTFFEFSYMLMQSYDFLVLNRKYGCMIQMGGSDQWSNILGGAELVKKHEDKQVYAMTFKLLTRADGVKMGKSMKGAIWLDEEKTSPYELFQYMRNSDDRDVKKFLMLLTFVPTEEIEELTKYNDERMNKAKEVLAYEIVKLIHGEEKAKEALETSKALFTKGAIDENMPTTEISKEDFENNKGLLSMLTFVGLTKSNGEARRLIQQGGIKLNESKVEDIAYELSEKDFKNNLIIQKGKKVFHRIVLA